MKKKYGKATLYKCLRNADDIINKFTEMGLFAPLLTIKEKDKLREIKDIVVNRYKNKGAQSGVQARIE